MKSTIGLLFFGLLCLQHVFADVSHLQQSNHNQYLPPVNQNLAHGQEYNRVNSQSQNNGYLPPINDNRGYLPPERSQNDHHHDQHHHNHNQQHHNDHDHNVQVSYHNDHVINGPQGVDHHHSNHDHPNDDHVNIDQQQLEPVVPSNFPSQAHGQPNTGPHDHHHHNTAPQFETNKQDDGYHYPPPARSPESLYPNQHHGSRHHSHQNPQQEYLPPPASNGHDHREPNRDYLPPSQSPPAPNGHDHHEPNRDYLPPSQSPPASNGHGHHEPNRDYLPPSQSPPAPNGHDHQEPNRDYLPPNQGNPNLSNHHVHQQPQQDYQNNQHHNPSVQNNYLPPLQSNHHNHHHHSELLQPAPQRDYLPPNNVNFVSRLSTRGHRLQDSDEVVSQFFVHDHSQLPDGNYLPPLNIVNNPTLPNPITIVPPPQLGLVEHQPRSQLSVKGHVNVPLPIPQVGYFFIPGIVSALPSPSQTKIEELRPAINIPTLVSTPQPLVELTQHISQPEYTNTLLVPRTREQSTHIEITPSIEAGHFIQTYHQSVPQFHQQIIPQSHRHTVLHGLNQLNNLQSIVSVQHQPQVNVIQQHHQHHVDQEYLPPNNLPNRGLSLQSIARTEVENLNRDYIPPVHDHQNHQHRQQSNQPTNNGYLPPPPHERYGAPHVHHSPSNGQINISPSRAPITLSKPQALQSYAPAMPYLPPYETPPTQSHHSIEEPLDQQHGRIRTVQIINDHSHSVKNIQVLETADHTGTKTIKILGRANGDPTGEHKVLRIINQGPRHDDHVQTVKIYADHQQVPLPSQNAYLPPARTRRLRHTDRSTGSYHSH